MSAIAPKWRLPRLGFLQIGIIVLVVITAILHLYLGIKMGSMMAGGPPSGGTHAGGPPSGGASGPGGGGGFSVMSLLPLPLPTLFDLNFVGYIVLVVALYLPALQRLQPVIRWLLIIYTAVTVVLWYLVTNGHGDMTAYIDKVVEIVLIALLLLEFWQNRRRVELPA